MQVKLIKDSYTRWLMLSMKWQACVNFASPMTAWTTRMHEILDECGGDRLKATFQLQEENIMAEALSVNKVEYHLKLSEREAKLIKALVKNSFYDHPEDEPASEAKDRKSIFEALQKADALL